MKGPWRLLACAAVLNVVAGAGVATAQTVNVTSAPPGATVELAMNTAVVATTKADATGRATFSVDLFAKKTPPQTDVRISVDMCTDLRRVVMVEPGLEGLPQGGCVRKDVAGVYLLKKGTGLVVDVVESAPAVWLRQGRVPLTWLTKEVESPQPDRVTRTVPSGFMPFGGVGLFNHMEGTTIGCGSAVTTCNAKTQAVSFAAGATFWLDPFIGVEVSYVKPLTATTTGSDTAYSYTAGLDASLVNIVGKVAFPYGPVRIYGQGGMNYHRVSLSTTEIVNDQTVTLDDGTTQVVKGGTQSFLLKTSGWGWVFGGGIEVWLNSTIGLYGDFGIAKVNGADINGGEGMINENVSFAMAGVRVRLHR